MIDHFRRLRTARKIVLIIGLGLLSFSVGYFLLLIFAPAHARSITCQPSCTSAKLNSQIEINFSYPPIKRALELHITPDVPGEWRWSGGFLGLFATSSYFVPNDHYISDTSYSVTVTAKKGLLSTKSITSKSFQTAPLPLIAGISTEESETLDPNGTIGIELSSVNDSYVSFEIEFSPPIDYSLEQTSLQTYRLIPKSPLLQGQKYSFRIFRLVTSPNIKDDRSKRELIKEGQFTTTPPPTIKTFSPQGENVLPTLNMIKIVFNQPMDPSQTNLAIDPTIPGEWLWDSSKTVATFPLTDTLPISTRYNITLKAGATSAESKLLRDVSFGFKTVGEVAIQTHQPQDKSSLVRRDSVVKITFNQPVSKEEVLRTFSINPAIAGVIQGEGSSFSFVPTVPFEYYLRYSIILAAGLRPVYGLPSQTEQRFSFTTEEKTQLLTVGNDQQDYKLSCEFASLKMALSYKGKNLSEDELISQAIIESTPRNGDLWGNPYTSFVGDINGTQNSTGYGIYWEPIAEISKRYRPSQAFTGWSLQDLTLELDQENPIVVWGTTGNAYRDDWRTPDGQIIIAWKGEHARVVVGYQGSSERPSYFYLNDPQTGRRVKWSSAQFQQNWSTFNNSGVVVR